MYPNTACNLSAAYNRAYAHVGGKCAAYDETMFQAEMGGVQQLVSMLLPGSFGELVEVRDPSTACIIRANYYVD